MEMERIGLHPGCVSRDKAYIRCIAILKQFTNLPKPFFSNHKSRS